MSDKPKPYSVPFILFCALFTSFCILMYFPSVRKSITPDPEIPLWQYERVQKLSSDPVLKTVIASMLDDNKITEAEYKTLGNITFDLEKKREPDKIKAIKQNILTIINTKEREKDERKDFKGIKKSNIRGQEAKKSKSTTTRVPSNENW